MNISLQASVVRKLIEKKLKISTAESCTGGLLSKLLTDVPGSSEVFMGGVVAYDNSVKKRLLDVPEKLLKSYGAVSFECAAAMAGGLKSSIPSDLHVSITGIAGPGGGTKEKPVGMVFIGIAVKKRTTVFRCFFRGARETIRKSSARKALELILEELISGDPGRNGGDGIVEKRLYKLRSK